MKRNLRLKLGSFRDINEISRLGFISATSSVLPLIGLPFIAKIYTPDVFGVFFSFSLIITIAAIVLTGRYESAIITIPASDQGERDLRNLVKLISRLVCVNSFLFFIALLGIQILNSSNVGQSSHFALISLLATLNAATAALTATQYTLDLRLGNTKVQGILIFWRALILLSSQVALGLISSSTLSLLIALLFSNIPNLVRLVYIWPQNSPFNSTDSRGALGKFSRFPKLQMPGAVLSALFFSVFVWGYSYNFGSASAGILAMALRFTYMPVIILSSAVNTIYLGTILKRSKNSSQLYESTKSIIVLLVFSGILISIANFILAHHVAIIFGPKWLLLKNFLIVTSVICPAFALLQILDSINQVIKRQDRIILWNSMFMIASILSVIMGTFLKLQPQEVILYFGTAVTLLVAIILLDVFSKIKKIPWPVVT